MPSKPPFHKQETKYSCVPACLRMILGSFGFDLEEERLRALCDCTVFGTDALKAVDAARQLGFPATAKYNLLINELETLVEDGHHPIAFLNLAPIDGLDEQHAVIVVEMNERAVVVFDPLFGERTLPRDIFQTAWGLQLYLTILVMR